MTTILSDNTASIIQHQRSTSIRIHSLMMICYREWMADPIWGLRVGAPRRVVRGEQSRMARQKNVKFLMLRVSRHLWGISAPNIMDFQIQSLIWVFSSDQWVEVFSWQVRSDCIWPQKSKVKGQRLFEFSVSESYQSRQEDWPELTTTLKQLQSRPRSTWRLLESKEDPEKLSQAAAAGPECWSRPR